MILAGRCKDQPGWGRLRLATELELGRRLEVLEVPGVGARRQAHSAEDKMGMEAPSRE